MGIFFLFRYAYEEKGVVVLVKELPDSPLKWYRELPNVSLDHWYYVVVIYWGGDLLI